MPHAVNEMDSQEAADDELITQLLNAAPQDGNQFDFDRELESTALEDALDYADISDDDLPEEEPSTRQLADTEGDNNLEDVVVETQEGLFGDGDEHDDLFGDGGDDDLFGDAPEDEAPQETNGIIKNTTTQLSLPGPQILKGLPTLNGHQSGSNSPVGESLAVRTPSPEAVAPETAEEREQRLLFEQARKGYEQRRTGAADDDIPAPPETDAELLQTIWPAYSRDELPRWGVLFPGKRAYYLYKQPLKPPKPTHPTKANLELEPDQERLFRSTTGTHLGKRTRREAEENGIFVITEQEEKENVTDDDLEIAPLDDEEIIGGLSIGDLRILCEDWDNSSVASEKDGDSGRMLVIHTESETPAPTKRQKVDARSILDSSSHVDDQLPALDDPSLLTAKLARRPLLELSDPNLLLDFHASPPKVQKPRFADAKRSAAGSFTKQMFAKWNHSQDKEYDLLRENQTNRVRSNLTKVEVKHALPAQKLQYPFYKVELSNREARSFHRPSLNVQVNHRITFDKLDRIKRQTLKEKTSDDIYATAKDLSLSDNSSMLLLEYSEEAPIVLSNFGMNSRLLNYYRRKDNEDTARPKRDIGDTQVLLPQDSSPFSIFGYVDPGEVIPTIHNEMFRAPVFKHDSKETDFLVIRSHTGIDGSKWYLRNIENLHTVGQQFPYIEVPGTHSRKVTDASKTRIKMLSFRIYRKNMMHNVRKPWLSHDMILKHAPGSDIPQNRSKMKEWMNYDSVGKSWLPKNNEAPPDEATVRSWLTPEALCVLDSMQVGHRHLLDAGYTKDQDEDADEKEGQSLEEELAPWFITKNFLKACQGNAMVQLHGEGDPTGRGEAFSFIKTSMKGGYKAVGQSIEDTISAQKLAEAGGHKYNVARQAQSYNDGIRRIWDAQQRSLSSNMEHSDVESDIDDEPDNRSGMPAQTPRSIVGTPAGTVRGRPDDESASQFSKFSAGDQSQKYLKITRTVWRSGEPCPETVVVTDPKVIKEYIRRKKQKELNARKLEELQPTGNAEFDSAQLARLEAELARLDKNIDRRHGREKMKKRKSGIGGTASSLLRDGDGGDLDNPDSPGGGGERGPKGTQRKCANCGQVGHIKTNKKMCPMLNGQWASGQGPSDASLGTGTGLGEGGISTPAPSFNISA